ncbi:MAG: metallophosphoesterase [Candidatus Obscuribacter sp.]|nr:metallophosphoesterase [Candidatus Obscuribacter sp.]MBP6350661.1 metallophosphoesterase [Candidatus Obscuribacter sp.]
MRFALLADCHIGEERPYEGVVRKLSRYALPFIDAIIGELGESVDFIVQLGDLIEDGADVQGDIDNYRAGIAAFARAPVPVLHVFGNHEQVHLTVPQLCAIAGQNDGGAAAEISRLAASPYYSRIIAGYKLIVLFSSSIAHTDIHVDREQIEWLKQVLKEGTEPVLVFVHHPLDEQSLIGNVWFEKYPHYCFCEERLELRQILEASKRVLAVFGGHVHQNSVSCINGIYYVTVQSLVERIERDGGSDTKGGGRDTKDAEPSRAYALVDVLKNEAGDHQLKIEVRGNDALVVDVKC